jgi:hypothetical protein
VGRRSAGPTTNAIKLRSNRPGVGLGGGLFNLGTASLTKSTIAGNKARGGSAGAGGLAGNGLGGGVYNGADAGATISIDPLTFVPGNTSDNRYGC